MSGETQQRKSRGLLARIWSLSVMLAFVVLVAVNVVLLLQVKEVDREMFALEQLEAEQTRVIGEAAGIRNAASERSRIAWNVGDNLREMNRWVRRADELVMAGRDRVTTQVISDESNRLRLMVYMPEGSGDVWFACKEVWGDQSRPQNAGVRRSDPRMWKNKAALKVAEGSAHELVFLVEDDEQPNLVVEVDGQRQQQFRIRPHRRRPGNAFGTYYTSYFPNQTSAGYGQGRMWEEDSGLRHSLLNHAFDLKNEETRESGGVVIQCWLESGQNTCIDADIFAASYREIVKNLLRSKQVELKDLDSLVLPYDGSGKFEFQPQWRDLDWKAP